MAYASLLVICLSGQWVPPMIPVLLLNSIFGFMLVFSLISAFGIMRKKVWGFKTGYAIAIIQLLFFPAGTVAGLILLIGLVGAAPVILSPREQRREERAKRHKKIGVA